MSTSNEPAQQYQQTYEQNPEVLPAELRNGALASASPEQISAAVSRFGARDVVWALWGRQSDEGWLRVIDNIATGEDAWLALVPLLRPGTDAGATESLQIAVSSALARNARGVLHLIDSGHEDISVCAMVAFEPTESELTEFYAQTIRAVEAVSDPDLHRERTDCLASLLEAKSELSP